MFACHFFVLYDISRTINYLFSKSFNFSRSLNFKSFCYFQLKKLGDCYGLMTLKFIFEDNKRGLDWKTDFKMYDTRICT
jgi:hypothetical protein